MQTKDQPIHESLLIGTLLTGAAGSFDAFTYLLHGEVFAGLQTGNVILLGVHLSQAQWYTAIRYVVPILAFMFGTMAARAIQLQADKRQHPLSEQRWIVQYEIGLILLVSLLGRWLPDLVASAMVSLIAAAQLQEFRRLRGGPFTSLMMTGNLRTAAQNLYDGFIRGQQKSRESAAVIGTIILSFAAGAGITSILTHYIGTYALAGAALCLIAIDGIFWQDQIKLH
ncbi:MULTISPECIES: YoaK family protein [Lacticaseibacillus]|uniref:YoaK family protein n=2 Tax=Lacticaseibacillus TaxID=2759736 RepID=A0AAN1F0J4_LACCA|nr:MULTISPECIES: YoaK family protein [Lacticaseibacillus]ARY92578.1 hypothetical protein BGL52_12775 [Lacticaseibacillus casei]KAB1969580.1 DUF1275 domain-containing protein [Lacticaseibacillus casei]WLV80479.1 YoaK family protein [Lacticaseibacillus sp. NCIMB 15473]WNX24440.1 YoaK family protein [Lacticaseibacillus casei]WNX27212.1 YoaK family protein [Lacticaseibacillus casei]